MALLHPAHTFSYEDLVRGLDQLVTKGQVNKRTSPNGHYILYNYASIVSVKWCPLMKLARGIVIDPEKKKISALPFPKFFNHNEHPPPDGYDQHKVISTEMKYDGSLGIVFWDEYDNDWCMITRGSFVSPQSKWGKSHFLGLSNLETLSKTNTYLFEIICPDSRVVVMYEDHHLRLLSAYNNMSFDLIDRSTLESIAVNIGTPIVERFDFSTISEIKDSLETMSGFNQEGYVVQLLSPDGTVERRKFKCKNYNTLHASKSNLTKKRVHEIMVTSPDDPMSTISTFADGQAEEHYDMIMSWANEIMSDFTEINTALQADIEATSHMDNKALGLLIKNPSDFKFNLHKKHQSLLFAARKGIDLTGKLWSCIAPK